MEIVIKLSERAYEFVKKNGLKDVFGIDSAICNGVVLPEGHGAIVDVEVLKAVLPIYVFRNEQGHFCKLSDIDKIPPSAVVIEADKEETTNETTD